MTEERRDRELGMGRRITRRDFLDGEAVGIGALGSARVGGWASAAGGTGDTAHPAAGSYPPALGGVRGSQPGSFDVAHSLRDGTFWDTAGKPLETGESYDLVVVGAGLGGLAAAYFYRKHAGASVRIQ